MALSYRVSSNCLNVEKEMPKPSKFYGHFIVFTAIVFASHHSLVNALITPSSSTVLLNKTRGGVCASSSFVERIHWHCRPGSTSSPSMTKLSKHFAASKSFEEALEVQSDGTPPWNKDTRTTDVIGHRGSIYEYVENTLEGFQRCANLQCSVELDIYELIPDGTLVVFHGGGSDLNPGVLHPQIAHHHHDTTTQQKSIMDCRWDEIESFQFNSSYEGYVCPKKAISRAKIPTLRRVLETLQPFPKTHLKLELKAGGPNLVRRAIQLVEEYHLVNRCTFSSFNHSLLHEIHTLNQRPVDQNNDKNNLHYYRTGALFDAPVPENFIALATGCDEIHLRYDTCTVSRVTEAQKCGFTVAAWFRGPVAMARDLSLRWDNVREEDLYQNLMQTGVQQICCNKPWVLLEMMLAVKTSPGLP